MEETEHRGPREGDEDHLRHRISSVGLRKDNRGVMRMVIHISLDGTNLHLNDAKQSDCSPHAAANNWVYRDDSSRRFSSEATTQKLVKHEILPHPRCTNKTWLLQGKSVFSAKSLFQSVWMMLISPCQDNSSCVRRTKGGAQRSAGIQEEL
ncbi:Hypothetical predicted protein [Xyrichtys novacula]|uniref:Uncharacterized protein n=1 Tax=Xyrichtys novacula TaxID=13765 RepID=A0AAV1H6Z9_XYRNO|nr:Hypothetical predicted protein [Xyrichtys novacula]